jgi:hypothetical protein
VATKDTNIADTCIYLEAIKGDGGARPTPAPNYWWLSPDVMLNDSALTSPAPPAGTSPAVAQAAPGDNAIGVRVHLKQGCQVLQGGTPPRVRVELFVSDAGMTIAGSSRIGNGDIDVSSLNVAGAIKQFLNWTVSGTGAETPGHKCLIARARPRNDSVDTTSIDHVTADQHYAQHNICIQPCDDEELAEGAIGGAGTGTAMLKLLLADAADGMHKFRLLTGNPGRRAAAAIIVTQVDLRPPAFAVRAATPALRRLEVPARPLTKGPRRIGLQINKIPVLAPAKPGTNTRRPASFWRGPVLTPLRPVAGLAQKKKVTLQPRQMVAVTVAVDLRGLPTGRPLFVNAMHQDSRGQVLGGCTIVFVLR